MFIRIIPLQIQTFESVMKVQWQIHKKTYNMLASIGMIIKNVDKWIPLIIIKIFETQSYVPRFHFFQDSWQLKLGKVFGKVFNRLLPNMKCMQLRVKIKSEKLLGMFPNMCRSKSISSLNMVEEWKWTWMANGDIQNSCNKRVRNPLHVFCIVWEQKKCYTDLKNMLKMSFQRHENRIIKWFVVYNLTYSGSQWIRMHKFEINIPRAQN